MLTVVLGFILRIMGVVMGVVMTSYCIGDIGHSIPNDIGS